MRRSIAAEPARCPTLTRGHYGYDFGDTAELTPLLPMHTLGHGFKPAPIHAGGLRYHGMAPLVSHLVQLGLVEAARLPAERVLRRGACASRAARASCPRPSRRTRSARWRRRSARADEEGVERTILFNLCGHGHFDLSAYDDFLAGRLVDHELPQEELDAAAACLRGCPGQANQGAGSLAGDAVLVAVELLVRVVERRSPEDRGDARGARCGAVLEHPRARAGRRGGRCRGRRTPSCR